MKKKRKNKIQVVIFSIIIIGILALFLFGQNINQAFVSEDSLIEAPLFATLECSPAPGGSVLDDPVSIRADGTFIKCPENSKNCDLLIDYPSRSILEKPYYFEYYTCDSTSFQGCSTPRTIEIPRQGAVDYEIVNNIPKDKFIYVQFQQLAFFDSNFLKADDSLNGRVQLRFIPYILWKDNPLEGGRNPVTTAGIGCRIDERKSYYLNAVTSSQIPIEDGIYNLKDVLEPDETYNYIAGTVTRAAFGNLITYKGTQGYCAENVQGKSLAQIYPIKQLKTVSRTYNVVDTSRVLGQEECCVEGRVVLNKVCEDFKLVDVQVDDNTGETNIECSFINPCNPGRFILGQGTKTYEFDCIGGQCVISDIQEEECVLNTDCSSGEICVNYQCEDAGETIVQIPTDLEASCNAKAEKYPLLGYEIVTKEPSILKEIVTLGFAKPKTFCRSKFLPWYVGGSIIFLLGLVLVLRLTPKRGRRK